MRSTIQGVDTSVRYHSRRLMDALSAIHAKPVTYIHAPMGYGKTVAVREYLKTQKALPCWISALTRDQEVFWRDFCSVLRKHLPGGTPAMGDLEALGYPSDPAKLDAARGIFARFEFPVGTVLVIDDVHLLPEPEGRQLLRLCLLLIRQGDFPHIVFISRHLPDRDFTVPRLKGVAAEIGPSLFALTREEVRAYSEQCGLTLKDTECAGLLKATGGWISALYLYLLHYTQHGQLAAPSELSDLLASQVFDRLRDEEKKLLTLLSPLDSFTVPQAGAFHENAEVVLAEILRRNAFIRFDPTTEGYTQHALFREFLLDRFGRLPVAQQQETRLHHARWLIRHDEIRKGVKLLGDVNSTAALELLDSVVERMPVTEGNGLLLTLFRSFQQSQMAHYPGLMFRYAMAALNARDIPAFADLTGRLERYCASLPADEPEANGWRGEMELLLSLTKYNDILAMSAHHKRAAEFFRLAGVERSRMFGQNPWTLGSPSILYMFHRESGTLEQTLQHMHECLPHYFRLTGMHGAGAGDAMLAEARFQAGEFESAEAVAHRALAMALKHDQVGIEVCVRFLLARLDLVRGEYDRAMDQMRVVRERVEESKTYSLLHTLDLCYGLLHAAVHRPEKIPDWLLHEAEEKFYAFAGGASYLAVGSALLLEKKYAELVGRFSLLLREGTFAMNLLFTIHANLFVAAGNVGLGLWADADDALLAALDLALPDRIYMPFAANADCLPQLKNFKDHERHGAGVRRILRLAASVEKTRNNILSRFFAQDKPSLTPRERELVRLALPGATYKEIADALGLSPSSVKRYFATLYKKLGISNREQLKHYFAGDGKMIP